MYADNLSHYDASFHSLCLRHSSTGSVYDVRYSEKWRHFIQNFIPIEMSNTTISEKTELDVRTASEHIKNIRNVFNPSVSDLAHLFDVSRQSIYKWLANESMPEEEKMERIIELSHIADAFHDAGIERGGILLKMKAFHGRSLWDLLKSGEDCRRQVRALINEAKMMDSSYKQSGLAESKSKPTRDWQASISIPGSIEED
ncbi:MAG: XRE family transcriptional regulator [Candidatus Omnitrophica bacterium]|nr:XRE family transcriptional regulator [Candidatus Omnitrophota bacterium]